MHSRYAEFTLLMNFNIAEENNINFEEIIELAKIDYPRLATCRPMVLSVAHV